MGLVDREGKDNNVSRSRITTASWIRHSTAIPTTATTTTPTTTATTAASNTTGPPQPVQPAPMAMNWSYFKSEFPGKPEEDQEAHILGMI